VEGTPALFTQSGDYIGGYLTTAQLVEALQESRQATAAAR
jgi:protein-disulfide isomerase